MSKPYLSVAFSVLLYAICLAMGVGFNLAWKSGDQGRIIVFLALFLGFFIWFCAIGGSSEFKKSDYRAHLFFARITMVWPAVLLATCCGMSVFTFGYSTFEEGFFYNGALILSWLYVGKVHYERLTATPATA
jgi:hypothetical protein